MPSDFVLNDLLARSSVAREQTICPGLQTVDSIREQAFTTSPSTVNSRRRGDPMSPVSATPLFSAMRIRSGLPGHSLFISASASPHGERGLDRPIGVILLRQRRAEDGEDRVADELVERAVELEDLLRHLREEVVQQLRHFERRHLLRPAS